MLTISPISAFDDNYIWLIESPEQQGVWVVDPGDAEPVLETLAKDDKSLAGILITHHHGDHTGGVNTLVAKFSCPVYGPENSPFKGITHPLADGGQVEVLGQQLTVKTVPGHTLDHICFYRQGTASEPSQLLCGDALFLAGCGRIFEGTAEQMFASMEYFNQLPGHTKIYPAHEYSLANLAFAAAVEPDNTDIHTAIEQCQVLRAEQRPTLPSNIEQEWRINPFLRYGQAAVIASASARQGEALTTAQAVFTQVREWKNNF